MDGPRDYHTMQVRQRQIHHLYVESKIEHNLSMKQTDSQGTDLWLLRGDGAGAGWIGS